MADPLDLGNISTRNRYWTGGESLAERYVRRQADAARPVDLSKIGNLPRSTNSNPVRPIPAANPPGVQPVATQTIPRAAPVSSAPTTAPTAPPVTAASPARIPLPSSARLAQIGRSAAVSAGYSALNETFNYGQGLLDTANEQIGNQLPAQLQPVWDRVAGPNGLLEGVATPPNLAGLRESARLQNDIPRLLSGAPARSQSGQIAQQLSCQIFGVGCPDEVGGVPTNGGSVPAPPFYGGQSAGVTYTVSIYRGLFKDGAPTRGYPDTYQTTAIGPVGGLYLEDIGGGQQALRLDHAGTQVPLGLSFPDEQWQDYRIVSVARSDGQPDTGGNPSPLPGSPNQPATAPALANRPISPPAGAPALPSTGVPNPATTPLGSDPSAPAGTDAPSPLDNLKDNLPDLLPLLGALPLLIPSFGNLFNPSGARQPGQGSGAPPATPSSDPKLQCRYDSAGISSKVDQANLTLNAVQLLVQQQVLSRLDTIDTKLGPQIPNGGVSGFLGKMMNLAKKTWDFLQIDRILAVLTWVGVLHNAYMLSNALGQTLFSAISSILDVFGVEDSEGNPLDVGAMVSKFTDNFFKSIFGVETVDGIKDAWKRFNRIYQAAANIVWSIQSITYSMIEILEVISNYVGRIGNALKKAGGVLENSFRWMQTDANYTNNRFFNALNNAGEAVEVVDQVASEVLSIQETGAELFNQKEELENSVDSAEQLIENQQATSKNESIKPSVAINPSDELRADP